MGDSRFFGHDYEIGSIATQMPRPFDPAPPDLTLSRSRSAEAIHNSRGRKSIVLRAQESRSDKELMASSALAQQDDVAVVVGAQKAEGLVVGGPVEVFDAIGFEFSDAMAG